MDVEHAKDRRPQFRRESPISIVPDGPGTPQSATNKLLKQSFRPSSAATYPDANMTFLLNLSVFDGAQSYTVMSIAHNIKIDRGVTIELPLSPSRPSMTLVDRCYRRAVPSAGRTGETLRVCYPRQSEQSSSREHGAG